VISNPVDAFWKWSGEASPFVSPDPEGSCAAALMRRIGASPRQALNEYDGNGFDMAWLQRLLAVRRA
jgi:hypothetical protein